MNNYDLKCYAKTYNDPRFWDGFQLRVKSDRKKLWGDCRGLTERFYDELISRGYLAPRANS